ncbi:uncharacterized protein K02A2.6-like [Melitaea cinxia]|uniref:uncharacterized protein K02A2.6-like n=1 Tax=Melitaea cinxia TaxID=113334 RepID=UPI001E26FF11|nr:uncharacterized protein K02A2.6-like [Melitaea cinxia]
MTHHYNYYIFFHLDLIGPLPISGGNRYCLTVIDRYTRWPEVIPLPDITAETVTKAFLAGWISRYGCPRKVITDQGRQFESRLFQNLAKLCGVKLARTTAYHPKANGMIERFHRTLKTALMTHGGKDWTESLPVVLLGLRAAWKEDLQFSSAELVFGEQLRIPGEFMTSSPNKVEYPDFIRALRHKMSELRPSPSSNHAQPRVFIHRDLSDATHVFLRQDLLRGSLEPPYAGPYKIISKTNKTMDLSIGNKIVKVSLDRVKPAYILNEEQGDDKKNLSTRKTTRSGRTVRFPDRYVP